MSKLAKSVIVITVTALSIIGAMLFGSAGLSYTDTLGCLLGQCNSSLTETLIWQVRFPRVVAGLVAGAGLAIAGAILQNATRNPLADPYLFGIVSGAGLGATIANLAFSQQLAITLPLAAFLGALFAIGLVLLLGKRLKQVEHLLLAGVAVSFMLGAIYQFLLYIGEPFATNRVVFWLMGSLARVEISNLYLMLPVTLMCSVIVVLYSRQLDALLLGDESAFTLGVNPEKVRLIMLAVCAALTATIVAYCGGLGFIGLMIPHIARQIFGVTTFKLVLGSAFLGSMFLIWVDVIARTLLDGQEIPIGVITAAIGSLFFIFILKQRSHS